MALVVLVGAGGAGGDLLVMGCGHIETTALKLIMIYVAEIQN